MGITTQTPDVFLNNVLIDEVLRKSIAQVAMVHWSFITITEVAQPAKDEIGDIVLTLSEQAGAETGLVRISFRISFLANQTSADIAEVKMYLEEDGHLQELLEKKVFFTMDVHPLISSVGEIHVAGYSNTFAGSVAGGTITVLVVICILGGIAYLLVASWDDITGSSRASADDVNARVNRLDEIRNEIRQRFETQSMERVGSHRSRAGSRDRVKTCAAGSASQGLEMRDARPTVVARHSV